MKLVQLRLILLATVLISCHFVACDSDNQTVESETEVVQVATEASEVVTQAAAETQELPSNSATEFLSYDDKDVDRFFEVLKKQFKCGYPKFGIGSLVPLTLPYKFKTSLDILNLKKIQISASNFVIHGLDNFSWKSSNTSFTRTKTNLMLNFPNVTINADTSLNRANGTSRLSLYDVLVFLEVQYEEQNDVLYVTNLEGDVSLMTASVKLAHLFPKSAKLTRIWNKAIGDSLPVLTKLITSRKVSVDFINRVVNGSRYYAINTANSALTSYKLNFDGLIKSLKRFSENTDDSLMCTGTTLVEQSRVI